ncbi:MAG TPA: hypothetical protein VLM83_08355 [Anaerolineales bacterium]|nr:hypothetical protein [Anaerolineales bacterium]
MSSIPLPPDLLDWLLSGEPWVAYHTRLDLLDQPASAPDVQAARQALLSHPQVQALVSELAAWPGPPVNSHKSAGQLLHKLSFLADLGLRAGDPGMPPVIEAILAHQSAQGPFQMLGNISPSYGGSGQDVLGWALCDAPTVVYSLVCFGLGTHPAVQRAAAHLVSLGRSNGWPCALSPEGGKWRGPGRKDDPCPYANLIMLKLLAHLSEYCDSPAARAGAETALSLWEHSREQHPYIFYMGTDFRKLKAPLVWYDLLHLCDVLTRFGWLRTDPRLLEMTALLRAQADPLGRFTPASIYQAWSAFDFGQKKVPSRWLTFLCWRTLSRVA